jgi:hypothetical protein
MSTEYSEMLRKRLNKSKRKSKCSMVNGHINGIKICPENRERIDGLNECVECRKIPDRKEILKDCIGMGTHKFCFNCAYWKVAYVKKLKENQYVCTRGVKRCNNGMQYHSNDPLCKWRFCSNFPGKYLSEDSTFGDILWEHPDNIEADLEVDDDPMMDKECISLCNVINSIPHIKICESCSGCGKSPMRVWFECAADKLSQLLILLESIDFWYGGWPGWIIKVCNRDDVEKPIVFLLESPDPKIKQAPVYKNETTVLDLSIYEQADRIAKNIENRMIECAKKLKRSGVILKGDIK